MLAEITMTVRQIMNLGVWTKVCEYKNWSPWILSEGQIEEDELVTFDDTFEKPELKYPPKEEKIILNKENSIALLNVLQDSIDRGIMVNRTTTKDLKDIIEKHTNVFGDWTFEDVEIIIKTKSHDF